MKRKDRKETVRPARVSQGAGNVGNCVHSTLALVRFRACHSVGLESWLNQERAVSSLAV